AHPTPHSAAHPAPTLPRKPTQSHLPPSLSRASSGRLSRSNSCASLDFQNESDKSQGGGVSTTLSPTHYIIAYDHTNNVIILHPTYNIFTITPLRPGAPLRSHFKTYELYEAVCEARRITIMRGLLEEVDSSVTRTLLLEALRLEAARLKEQGLLVEFQGQPYLPVTSCFAVLEETRELHLNRSQVMFIISWAECFDKDGTNLDLERFAEHAANIVSKLGDNDLVATRAALATTIVTTEKVTIYNTLYTIHYTLYTKHYTLYTIHNTLYTIHLHYTLYTIHYTLYTIHYTLRTIHYTLYTIHYTLYTIHYTLYTIHYTLYT
ncbi:hypothetical protein B484DRAFT_928, partial [Ochromonadaceae sp. CCMP2298]